MFPSSEELKDILERAVRTAKAEAKEAGASIYYYEEGKRIREAADGTKYEILIDESGKRKEQITEFERPKFKYMTTNPPKWAVTVLDMFK